MRPPDSHRIIAALLTLVLAWPVPAARAESGAYRIELLVFQYPGDAHPPRERSPMDAFPAAFELDAQRAVYLTEDPAPLGVMSDLMRDAWRRLDRQSDYRPLLYLNWEQSRIDYQPPVRVHDDQVVFERLWFPGEQAWIDLEQDDFLAPYRQTFYRLDGTAQLRRTRFLHLELDLRLRSGLLPVEPAEPATTAVVLPPMLATSPDSITLRQPEPAPPVPGALEFRLHESRQIKTEEMNYFDTPTLGVLAWVTATTGE